MIWLLPVGCRPEEWTGIKSSAFSRHVWDGSEFIFAGQELPECVQPEHGHDLQHAGPCVLLVLHAGDYRGCGE